MGYLDRHADVETWLRADAVRFEPLSKREYTELVTSWREQFEQPLARGQAIAHLKAEQAIRNELPCDVWVFSIPGYRFLPAGTDAKRDPTYAYKVGALSRMDFEAANRADAIVSDIHLAFTFLGTHEADAMAYPQFVHA